MRAAVVVVQEERVALIERRREGSLYFVFPGGGVESGESAEEAAAREALEELGVSVEVGDLAFTRTHKGRDERYHFASIVGGVFGSGEGEEMVNSGSSIRGTYRPIWMDLSDLTSYDVRPVRLAEALFSGRLH